MRFRLSNTFCGLFVFALVSTAVHSHQLSAGDLPTPALTGSVTASGNTLLVFGTDDDNVIQISPAGNELQVVIDGCDHGTFATPQGLLRVFGKAGNDTINLTASLSVNTQMYGGLGDDTIRGANGEDEIFGGGGADELIGRGGNDNLVGGDGDDLIFGQAGDDEIYGGLGNDQIVGAEGDDRILAGPGDDEVEGNEGLDYLDGGLGFDLYDDIGELGHFNFEAPLP